MTRKRKLQIIIPIVIFLFLGAYIRHRFLAAQLNIPGRLRNWTMNEVSGMAASSLMADRFYVHNDSGDKGRFFIISSTGELINTVALVNATKQAVRFRDCEDIAVGPGPVRNKSYIYLGDVGDNGTSRSSIPILRIPESLALLTDKKDEATAATLYLKYPDGAKDCETLMVDPIEKLFYIVTKRKDTVRVYTAPLLYKNNDTVTMTFRTKLFFAGVKPLKWITAGDISKDGLQVLVKSYEKVYYWRRNPGEAIWQTLQRPARTLPYEQEKQGEAIAFAADGKGYYTTSEGVFSPIYFYNTP